MFPPSHCVGSFRLDPHGIGKSRSILDKHHGQVETRGCGVVSIFLCCEWYITMRSSKLTVTFLLHGYRKLPGTTALGSDRASLAMRDVSLSNLYHRRTNETQIPVRHHGDETK